MSLLMNPWRGQRLLPVEDVPPPSTDAARVLALAERCPRHAVTPLVEVPALAKEMGVAAVHAKMEGPRMGLGSFKALGAAYVIAHLAQNEDVSKRVFVTASAGNHGMSVAAGAQAFGATAKVYLDRNVPLDIDDRLKSFGAEVVRIDATYEEAMNQSAVDAEANGWTLLSDGSWPGYIDLPHRLKEGYTLLAQEIVEQMPQQATHIFLQAGVGGIACAAAALLREAWGDAPTMIVVEPDRGRALFASVAAGQCVEATGPVSVMGKLDCKVPSLVALQGLAHDADAFLLISDDHSVAIAERVPSWIKGATSTPSGASGIAGLAHVVDQGLAKTLRLDASSRVLCIVSEGSVA